MLEIRRHSVVRDVGVQEGDVERLGRGGVRAGVADDELDLFSNARATQGLLERRKKARLGLFCDVDREHPGPGGGEEERRAPLEPADLGYPGCVERLDQPPQECRLIELKPREAVRDRALT